jgi:hypothetical protein
MGSETGKRWQFITTTGVAVLFGVATVAVVPDASTKLWVAAIMVAGAAALAVNAFFFTPRQPSSPTAVTTATASASPPVAREAGRLQSLEEKEDPALLQAAGYIRSEYPHRWEKAQPDVDAPFEETAIILYDDQGNWETSASVFIVLKDCAWVQGSARFFRNRNNTPCSLETLLDFPEFQRRLSSASHLVFVGMESYLNAPKAAASDECGHGFLTTCRADRLITRTYVKYFSDDKKPRPDLWELDIGYANTKSPLLEWDQRRAVILGMRNRRPGLTVEDAVTKVATGARVGVIRLRDYSNAATARASRVPYDAWTPAGPDTHH